MSSGCSDGDLEFGPLDGCSVGCSVGCSECSCMVGSGDVARVLEGDATIDGSGLGENSARLGDGGLSWSPLSA